MLILKLQDIRKCVMKNLQELLKQAKVLQDQMQTEQKKLESTEFRGEAGAGMVVVTMTGDHKAKSITIDQSLFDNERDMLPDLIIAAFNDAVSKIESHIKTSMRMPEMPNLFGM